MSLEFNHFSLGLNPFSCKIIDKNNARRFDIYVTKIQLPIVV